MNWMDQIGGILQQYTGAGAQAAPSGVHDDFDRFAQAAPQSAVADGLAAAFRSNETPPFPQMLGHLFGQSNGQQRAGILNTLISAVGPSLLSQIIARRGGGGGGGLAGLAGLLGGGQQQVSPEVAQQVPPEAVQEIAQHAEQQDPSIIDTVSNVYAAHPQLVKTLGAAALTVALAKIASARQGG